MLITKSLVVHLVLVRMLCSKEAITPIQTNKNANTSTQMHLTFASMNHAIILLALEKPAVLLLALEVPHLHRLGLLHLPLLDPLLDLLPHPLDLQAELEVLLPLHQLQHLAQVTMVNALPVWLAARRPLKQMPNTSAVLLVLNVSILVTLVCAVDHPLLVVSTAQQIPSNLLAVTLATSSVTQLRAAWKSKKKLYREIHSR